jgi:hypothetical protein
MENNVTMETKVRKLPPINKANLFPYLLTSAPEDGDSMFLRNVGIDLQIHTVPEPKPLTT